MVVFGQNYCIPANWLFLVKVVLFGKSGCIRAKMLYSNKSGCIRKKLLYSGKSGIIRLKWLYSGESGFFPESGCICAKVVVFGQKW